MIPVTLKVQDREKTMQEGKTEGGMSVMKRRVIPQLKVGCDEFPVTYSGFALPWHPGEHSTNVNTRQTSGEVYPDEIDELGVFDAKKKTLTTV